MLFLRVCIYTHVKETCVPMEDCEVLSDVFERG